MQIYGTATLYEGPGRRPRGETPPWTRSLLPKAPPDPPKHAEFHLAKRLQREAEELLARRSMSSL
jgi:hypothetical protein